MTPYWYAIVSESCPAINTTRKTEPEAASLAGKLREDYPDVEVVPMWRDAGARAGDGNYLAEAFELFQRLEDAASQALTDANNAGKVANRPGIHIQSIKSAGELWNAIVAVKRAYRALLAAAPAVSAPAALKPLTDYQIVRIYGRPELAGTRHESGTEKAIAIARAIEAAHGIQAPATAAAAGEAS